MGLEEMIRPAVTIADDIPAVLRAAMGRKGKQESQDLVAPQRSILETLRHFFTKQANWGPTTQDIEEARKFKERYPQTQQGAQELWKSRVAGGLQRSSGFSPSGKLTSTGSEVGDSLPALRPGGAPATWRTPVKPSMADPQMPAMRSGQPAGGTKTFQGSSPRTPGIWGQQRAPFAGENVVDAMGTRKQMPFDWRSDPQRNAAVAKMKPVQQRPPVPPSAPSAPGSQPAPVQGQSTTQADRNRQRAEENWARFAEAQTGVSRAAKSGLPPLPSRPPAEVGRDGLSSIPSDEIHDEDRPVTAAPDNGPAPPLRPQAPPHMQMPASRADGSPAAPPVPPRTSRGDSNQRLTDVAPRLRETQQRQFMLNPSESPDAYQQRTYERQNAAEYADKNRRNTPAESAAQEARDTRDKATALRMRQSSYDAAQHRQRMASLNAEDDARRSQAQAQVQAPTSQPTSQPTSPSRRGYGNGITATLSDAQQKTYESNTGDNGPTPAPVTSLAWHSGPATKQLSSPAPARAGRPTGTGPRSRRPGETPGPSSRGSPKARSSGPLSSVSASYSGKLSASISLVDATAKAATIRHRTYSHAQ